MPSSTPKPNPSASAWPMAPMQIVLTVHNDGLPFPSLKSSSTGMGLRIMNYRASLIGATLEIKGDGPARHVRRLLRAAGGKK